MDLACSYRCVTASEVWCETLAALLESTLQWLRSRSRWGPGIVGASFVDFPPGMTEGMSMIKRVCAAIGLVTIAMLSIPLSLYGA